MTTREPGDLPSTGPGAIRCLSTETGRRGARLAVSGGRPPGARFRLGARFPVPKLAQARQDAVAVMEDRMNTTATSRPSAAQTIRRPAALVTLLAGLALVFLTGFSHSATIHNAAHDTRHAMAFPCH